MPDSTQLTGGCLSAATRFGLILHGALVAYAAPWEPIPDDGLKLYPNGRPYE